MYLFDFNGKAAKTRTGNARIGLPSHIKQGGIKKSLLREKIQNREAILNFFESVTLMTPKMIQN